jgi:3-phenylpropionate/cinnamic acid dioxygenase small subunit
MVSVSDDRLEALVDRQTVVDLAVRYATALDTKDWSLLATCFVPDAVAIYSTRGRVEGYPGIEEVCRGALGPLTASQHLLGNHVVELDGDEGRASCYFQAQHVLTGTDGGDTYIVAGTYRDRVVRSPEGWKIAERQLTVLWTQGNERVLHPARA